MKIGLLQTNTTVGDFDANAERILDGYHEAMERGAEMVVTPELAVSGYPPQDLVFKSQFVPRNLEKLRWLHDRVGDVPLVVGFVDTNDGRAGNLFRNGAALLQRKRPARVTYKSLLPTYDVFDEGRYFQPAEQLEPIEIAGVPVGITICEDVWERPFLPARLYVEDPVQTLVSKGARIIVNLSASPFHLGKPRERLEMLSALARKHRVTIAYCNAIGGNDQLIFDGSSLVVGADSELKLLLPSFQETLDVCDTESGAKVTPDFLSDGAELHDALCLGLSDYMRKCGFETAVLGLSGGIDSAVTACIAVEAIGSENVSAVAMPTEYSSESSVTDARQLAETLGIQFRIISIQETFEVFRSQFQDLFAESALDITEENMQPRIRAMTLMALSNRFGHLLLTTGNKSELAVGYCTLYGDMAGGLAVISDVPKTKVYELAEWMNRDREIIPRSILKKPPSAELKPGQKDQDTLPPYEILDQILELYVEQHLSASDIIRRGFDEETVRWIQRRVDLNEYKREQAAPGLRVTSKAFGPGRRMPIAQRFVD